MMVDFDRLISSDRLIRAAPYTGPTTAVRDTIKNCNDRSGLEVQGAGFFFINTLSRETHANKKNRALDHFIFGIPPIRGRGGGLR